MPIRSVPGMASVATPVDCKLYAPSAARNLQALGDLLAQLAPEQGHALEIASGTGQHIVGYATRLPGLTWQPTEVDEVRRASIDAYVSEAGLSNILAAQELDATAPGWGTQHHGQDMIILSNLLHLISEGEAKTLISEAAAALSPGGQLVIYGPFMRGDELTSEGDATFHASLRAHDPETGYKDDFDTMDWLQEAGLEMVDVIEMPANNLALISKKSAV
ncbi:methyltransferase [Rhodobacterales bacterium 56_14_T64]|nr:methyltransferase [Rhodobacterales bacterium 56_14_T64]